MASKPANFEVYTRLRETAEGKSGSTITINGDFVQQGANAVACKKAFGGDATNAQVYDGAIKPNVDRVMMGHNVHVITYGGPTSGKAFTVLGNEQNPGLIARAVEGIFANTVAPGNQNKYLISVSMYQVQTSFSAAKNKGREFITDLINPDTTKTLALVEFRDVVDGIADIVVKSAEQAMTYIRQGWAIHKLLAQRQATEKGHVFVDIRVESMDRDDPFRVTYATLRFAVLAAASKRATEHNNGLREFGAVVNARASNSDDFQIAYAASKVTALLQPCLSSTQANAHGVFLLLLTQGVDANDHLTLATKVQSLSVASKVNFNTITAAVRDLREEIRRRRDELKLDNPTTYLQDVKAESIQALQRLIVELERVKSQTWKCKRDNSAAVLRQRVARLKAEGLVGVLAETAAEVAPELKADARDKLRALVSRHNQLREQESKVDITRKRLQVLSNRYKPDGPGAEKLKPQLEKQQAQLKTEEAAMNKAIAQYNAAMADFMASQKRVLSQEAKLSKTYIFPEDAAAVQRARDQEIWNEMKNERETLLEDEVKASQARAEQFKRDAAAATDLEACRKIVENMAELLQQRDMRIRALEVDKDLITGAMFRKDATQEVQLQKFQEHMFFVFRNYRSHFEDQKARIEHRYRELLESSVKDALKLQEECTRMRAELHKRSTY